MASTKALGDEPIVFFTQDGKEVFLPVSDIYFENGVAASRSDTISVGLAEWLAYLVAQGRLVPAPTLAPGPAMVFSAAVAGSSGNNIVVEVTANGPTKVDIRVTETDLYDDLTLDSTSPNYLPTVVGVTGQPGTRGTRPGLVRVQPITGNPPDPAKGAAVSVLPVDNHTPTWTIAGVAQGTTSFTLEARGPDSDVGEWTIEVTDVQPGTGRKKFTLKIAWTNRVTVSAADLTVNPATSASKLYPLAFAVAITKPAGSTELKLPSLGSFNLGGGAEPAESTKAKATLLANA